MSLTRYKKENSELAHQLTPMTQMISFKDWKNCKNR